MNGDGGRSSTPSGGGVRNPYARTNNRAQPRPTSSITARHFGTSGSTSQAAPPPPVAQPGASNAPGTRENYVQAINTSTSSRSNTPLSKN
mmetsp:Transcript_22944/g.51129  ORF Transcript_22944/g.51129 Transcript_22944/m.51129 type:complete len:90 (-) Transcript_22944:68-337(-)